MSSTEKRPFWTWTSEASNWYGKEFIDPEKFIPYWFLVP
jgi:hypothetical protein